MARKSRKNIDTNIEVQVRKKLKTVMYLRLSVEDKDVNSSIDTQRDIIKNYMSGNSEFELCGEFVDNGKTGTNFKRIGFLKMIEAVEKGDIDCIIVKDLSRFGRNMIDTGHYIEKFLPMYNVRFIAVNDNFDTNNKDENSLILPLKNIINETYARDVSFKVRKEVRAAMERGECINAKAPLGYARIKENKKNKFVVDEETASVVRKIFNLALDGLSHYEIGATLDQENVPTPNVFRKKQGVVKDDKLVGTKWQGSYIRSILLNEVYIGNLVQGRRSKVGGKDIKLPREEWIIFKDNHTPIIDKHTFYSVQKIIEERDKKRTRSN